MSLLTAFALKLSGRIACSNGTPSQKPDVSSPILQPSMTPIPQDELQLLMNYPQPPAFRHMPAFQWMVAFFLKGVAEDRFQQPIPLVT